jgi:hypothetical protein
MNQKNKAVISCDAWHAFVNLEAVLSTPEISSQGILDNSTPEPSREPNSSATLTRSDHFPQPGKMVSDNSEPSRGVVTGNPCGTDTVPYGKQCPSESGVCMHRQILEPTQEQVEAWAKESSVHETKRLDAGLVYVASSRELQRFATLAHAAGFEAGRKAGIDQGKLWSIFRTLLSQGGDIQLDYNAGKYSCHEEYSARLDAAARERVKQFIDRAMQEGKS